ncbi:uncharacterized protein [Battus philenor]|uniref:uncharacterized protein n=1 Tax=Battus philenor TaxID=42288 RepID=UPI0035D01A28
MFIYVIYKDEPELSLMRRRSSEPEPDPSVEQTLLLNPDCHVRVMLEYIRKKCKLGIYTQFDLCDEEGFLKRLFTYAPYTNAADFFEHRKTYYVVVLRQESEMRISVLPQLNHDNLLYEELKAKIRYNMTGDSSHTSPPSKISTVILSKTSVKPIIKKK